jgi:hypothetical protein
MERYCSIQEKLFQSPIIQRFGWKTHFYIVIHWSYRRKTIFKSDILNKAVDIEQIIYI